MIGIARRAWAAAVLGCLPVAAGCAEYYWADTTIHSDGCVERAIVQPRSSLTAGFDERKWDAVFGTRKLDGGLSWPRSRTELSAPSAPTPNSEYVAALGEFPTVADIPSHFEAKPPEGVEGRAELVRTYDRRDFGLFVEHVWMEKLTDIVELGDLLRARRELAHLVIEDGERFARIAFPDVDAGPLMKWVRDEGVAWFDELVDAMVETASQSESMEAFERRAVAICARHGLDLSDPPNPEKTENPIEPGFSESLGDRIDQRFEVFLRAKCVDLLRDTNGNRLSDARIDAILDEFVGDTERAAESKSRLESLGDAYIIERYGNREVYERRLHGLLARVVGVHNARLGLRLFRYSVTMPGWIVSTTGVLVDDHQSVFVFRANDAYPFGHVMACRSLEPDIESQAKCLGTVRIADRASLTRLKEFCDNDPGLAESFRTAVRDGALRPIAEHLAGDACALPTRSQDEVRRMMGLE